MIGKLLNLPYQKIAKTVHGEMEQNKRRSQQKKSNQDEENEEPQDPTTDIAETELKSWIKELNCLECYEKNNLQFMLSAEQEHWIVRLVDIKGHTLQEYLPVQFKALFEHLKKDKDDSKKGTILNLNC